MRGRAASLPMLVVVDEKAQRVEIRPAAERDSAMPVGVSIGRVVAQTVVRDVTVSINDVVVLSDSVNPAQTPEEATAAVEDVAPSLGVYLRSQRAYQSRQEFLIFLTVLLAVLQLAVSWRDEGLSEKQIADLIDQTFSQMQQPQTPPVPPQQPPPRDR